MHIYIYFLIEIAEEDCPSSLTRLPSLRLNLTSNSKSDFASEVRLKSSTPPELLNVIFTPPPGDKASSMPFIAVAEQYLLRDTFECMEVEATVEPTTGPTQTTDSELVYVSMPVEEGPSTSTTGSGEMCLQGSQGENELMPPPEEVAMTVISTSPGQSAFKICKSSRKKGPPKVKAPKATKSRRQTANKKQSPNKRMKVDSSKVTEQQESVEKAPIATNSQDPFQTQSLVLPDDEPSSSSQFPDTQLGEGT